MDKKQRYMNLAIIVILVVFVTIRALPKKALDLDPSGGLFSQPLIGQLTEHIKPHGRLLVSQFSRNNNESENFSVDLIAEGEGDRSGLWYLIYNAAEDKPYRAYNQADQNGGDFSALPTIEDAFAQLDRLHPWMPALMDTLTGEPINGVTPFLSIRSNYHWDGELLLEQQTVLDQKEGGGTQTIPGGQVSALTDVRYFTYGDSLTECAITDAHVDAGSFLVYQSDIRENIQIDRLVAVVNPASVPAPR